MSDIENYRRILSQKGNFYRTKVVFDEDSLELTQLRLLPGLSVLCFAVMGYFMSPWLGVPLAVAGVLLVAWQKSLRISLEEGEIVAVSGIPPLLKTFRGTRDDVNHIQLREVVATRTTDGTLSAGRWRSWDVHLFAFDEAFVFSVWEQGCDQQPRLVAEALAELFNCPLKELSN